MFDEEPEFPARRISGRRPGLRSLGSSRGRFDDRWFYFCLESIDEYTDLFGYRVALDQINTAGRRNQFCAGKGWSLGCFRAGSVLLE